MFKPPGPSSTQFGARLRWIYGTRDAPKLAVGHVGTLDPLAAGVLPIALGRATRLIPLIADKRKSYAFTLVLGHATSSGDAAGEATATAPVPPDPVALLERVLPGFIGRGEQIPPMVSALKVEGRRLYRLAREGKVVERKPRAITIYALAILGEEREPPAIRLRVACSEGTYVRTLAEDLARAIGTVGHVGALLREGSGPFVLSESVTLDEVAADPARALIPPERVIAIPTIVLDGRGSADFRAGRIVAMREPVGGTHVFVRDMTRTLVGVGEMHGTMLAPRKVFV
ncbi:MAG: tRNA pseudouridine(55) synthase TruB [Candidatus Eremiobacteraeota bacterium]|nr:tRNA pseudouridine(55) synthase TruB [Candidatus Eremiobacteraeota bacterium]